MDYTYKKMLIKGALSGKDIFFANSGSECAVSALSSIISLATESLIILCHKLSAKVYGNFDVVEALRKATNRNPQLKIHVFLRDKQADITPFLTLLKLKNATIEYNFKTPSQTGDLCVGDYKNYRYETDDKTKCADIRFNNPEEARRILSSLEMHI